MFTFRVLARSHACTAKFESITLFIGFHSEQRKDMPYCSPATIGLCDLFSGICMKFTIL
jgi:hypothetical protein